jgi:hypothetical protein
MRLLILKTGFNPSSEEWNRLEKLQTWFSDTEQSIFVDVKFDKYNYIIRREQLARRLRSKWKVLTSDYIPVIEEEKRISGG